MRCTVKWLAVRIRRGLAWQALFFCAAAGCAVDVRDLHLVMGDSGAGREDAGSTGVSSTNDADRTGTDGSARPDGGSGSAEGGAGQCTAGDQRCHPSAPGIQKCDLAGVWRDTTTCPAVCSGTGPSTACTGSCKPGTRSCGTNDTPFLCDAMGANQPQSPCSGLCSDGACLGECKPSATRCTPNSTTMFQTCDATGQWGAPQACTYVCDPTSNQCGGECSPGMAGRCASNAVQTCDATGHWQTTTTCTTTPCSMGQCRACTTSEKQCNGGKPQTCSANGTWTDDQADPCPFLCDMTTGRCTGECVPATDACGAGQTTKHCGANGVYGAPTVCANICDASTGRCGGICAPSAHRCNGSATQTCGSDGQWGANQSCSFGCSATTGQCNACTDDPLTTTCNGGRCGPTANNCMRMVTCPDCTGTGETCGGGGIAGVCGCGPDPLTTTCQNGARCGNVTNNCGGMVSCGNCSGGQECSLLPATLNLCCAPETTAQTCTRLSRNCGMLTAADNCGVMRTVTSCGTCTGVGQTCGTSGVCGCTAETNTAFCMRLAKTCGSVTAADSCGASRTVNCGTCTSPQVCEPATGSAPNTCCSPETDASICTRLARTCGTASATDNCGSSRSVNCGNCNTLTLTVATGSMADFGSVTLGSGVPVTETFVLRNTGTAATNNVTIGGLTAPFSLANRITADCVNGGPLAAGASCNIRVTFAPVSNGLFTTTLQASASPLGGTVTLPLRGTGLAPPTL